MQSTLVEALAAFLLPFVMAFFLSASDKKKKRMCVCVCDVIWIVFIRE